MAADELTAAKGWRSSECRPHHVLAVSTAGTVGAQWACSLRVSRRVVPRWPRARVKVCLGRRLVPFDGGGCVSLCGDRIGAMGRVDREGRSGDRARSFGCLDGYGARARWAL